MAAIIGAIFNTFRRGKKKTQIIVERKHTMVSTQIAPYDIFIDENPNPIEKVNINDSVTIPLKAGKHRIFVTQQRPEGPITSKNIEFNLNEGDTKHFKCRPIYRYMYMLPVEIDLYKID
ncbi:MAG: hypothetical protein N838_27085 [Thiohalocapsa sp. PB-PSB1]|nr:MAG: hypothetical protein N838_27085 [Thiohalocapsa sp. PB-PSB1]